MIGWKRAFTLEGLNLERLLRTAAARGVRLDEVQRRDGRCLTGIVRESDMARLLELSDQSGCRLTPGKRTGGGAVFDRARRRWLLCLGAIIGLAVALMGTQILWQIEIVNGGTYTADIRAALEEMGIRVPMLRAGVETDRIRDTLEWRYPQIAWVECGWRGMSLTIRLVEGVLPSDKGGTSGDCDIVAARDGVVSSIITRAGTPVVRIGETVRKGQVLIKGEERTAQGLTKPVAARGSVYARIWDAAAVRMSLMKMETVYTGQQQTQVTIRCPWFDLWPVEDTCYGQEDMSVREMPLGGFFIPLVLRTETHMQAEISRLPRDTEEVRQEAETAALRKLYEKTGGKESLVDNWVNWSMIEDEILLSVAYGERIVDIAQQERSSVMAAAD